MRRHAPLLLLLFAACPKDKDQGGRGGARAVEIPDGWESREASVVMRLTNQSSTSTEVRRALNELFNDPQGPVDAFDLLMRSPQRDAAGAILPVDASLSTAQLLAGSALEQATAYRARVIDGGSAPFPRDEVRDACGNEMILSMVTPSTLSAAFPAGPTGLPVWPASCPDGPLCGSNTQGTWDVALGEMRFDGMIDMVVNVFPDTRTTPIAPGAWGHLSGFFLSTNNPGVTALPLFANVRRAQINLTGVWELDRTYVDPVGVREVYKFPHRTRRLDANDVFVFLEGYKGADEVWRADGLAGNDLPFGFEQSSPIALDTTAPAGAQALGTFGRDDKLLTMLSDVVAYQIGAAISCPSVRDAAYMRHGPVEFFLCPDVDIDECIAREDMEEGACVWQEEADPSPGNPFGVSFARRLIANPSTPVPFPEARLPGYLASPVPDVQGKVQLDVNPDSVLYLLAPERVVAVHTQTGLPVTLPTPVANSHCTDNPVQRFNLGEEWSPGTYTLTVDFDADPDGIPGSGDEIVVENDIGGTSYMVWMYYTSLQAWSTGG